jgi:hypothetical protein
MKTKLLKITKKFLLFVIILAVLYIVWIPFSLPYQWIRLKISYLLLNVFGFYPKFVSPTTNLWMGEYFTFLPYFALMIVTYQKKILHHIKNILVVLGILIFMEIIGRFFSELSIFLPKSQFVNPIAIFLLATARPALPFLFWFFEILKENNQTV